VTGLDLGTVHAFLGVPYAAPPVGDRRFRPPAPAVPWPGRRECRRFGPAAPQLPLPGSSGNILVGDTAVQDEDCLTLNVWAPAARTGLPVLVFVHGGGYLVGSPASPLYDGAGLARRGAVVVTVSYRLGALGFLAHPALAATEGEPVGNWGLLDQLAALEWVRANIEGFGGDPTRVTVFGQSSGSRAALTLLAMRTPSPRPFHAIIGQSGPPVAASVAEAASVADDVCARLGMGDPRRLRTCPLDRLLAAQAEVASTAARFADFRFQPVIDDVTLDRHPMAAIQDGEAATAPVMAGTTRDEMALYADHMVGRCLDASRLVEEVADVLVGRASDPVAAAREAVAAYETARAARGEPVDARWLWTAIATDVFFRLPAIAVAEGFRQAQPHAYMYLFDRPSPRDPGRLGAGHGLDLAFVFGAFDDRKVAAFAGGPGAAELSGLVQDLWLDFARTNGRPDGWPAYAPDERATMRFGAGAEVVHAPLEEERRVLRELLDGKGVGP
jgi:para-nitrobenzyl esterase